MECEAFAFRIRNQVSNQDICSGTKSYRLGVRSRTFYVQTCATVTIQINLTYTMEFPKFLRALVENTRGRIINRAQLKELWKQQKLPNAEIGPSSAPGR